MTATVKGKQRFCDECRPKAKWFSQNEQRQAAIKKAAIEKANEDYTRLSKICDQYSVLTRDLKVKITELQKRVAELEGNIVSKAIEDYSEEEV